MNQTNKSNDAHVDEATGPLSSLEQLDKGSLIYWLFFFFFSTHDLN